MPPLEVVLADGEVWCMSNRRLTELKWLQAMQQDETVGATCKQSPWLILISLLGFRNCLPKHSMEAEAPVGLTQPRVLVDLNNEFHQLQQSVGEPCTTIKGFMLLQKRSHEICASACYILHKQNRQRVSREAHSEHVFVEHRHVFRTKLLDNVTGFQFPAILSHVRNLQLGYNQIVARLELIRNSVKSSAKVLCSEATPIQTETQQLFEKMYLLLMLRRPPIPEFRSTPEKVVVCPSMVLRRRDAFLICGAKPSS